MIKVEVVDGNFELGNDAYFIIFYKTDKGVQQYVICRPIVLEGKVVSLPDELKCILNRGFTVTEVYEVEPCDVDGLVKAYAHSTIVA